MILFNFVNTVLNAEQPEPEIFSEKASGVVQSFSVREALAENCLLTSYNPGTDREGN
jgi:hypothetical protein